MAKATTKAELIKSANEDFDKMWKLIAGLSKEQQEQGFTYDADALTAKDGAAHWKRDKNLRDCLTHLYEWHQLLLNWVAAAKQGEPKPFLPTPYTWTTYQQMNVEFYNKHQATELTTAKQMLIDSHKDVMTLTEVYSDLELFEKKHFTWTGTSCLAQYIHSATVAHYNWAIKKLKEYTKALKSS